MSILRDRRSDLNVKLEKDCIHFPRPDSIGMMVVTSPCTQLAHMIWIKSNNCAVIKLQLVILSKAKVNIDPHLF